MKPLILIVDDNEDMLEFLSSVLSSIYNVITTNDARLLLIYITTFAKEVKEKFSNKILRKSSWLLSYGF